MRWKKQHRNARPGFSREEQEAWGMIISREAGANIRARLALPASQLSEVLDRALTDRVHAVLGANGKKTGPKISANKNQRMVQMLHSLAQGKALKEVVRRAAWYRNESAQLLRFCVNFYELASMLKKTGADKNDPYVIKVFKERFGFNLPADWPAVREAYRRGLLYYKRPRRDRSSRRKQLPALAQLN